MIDALVVPPLACFALIALGLALRGRWRRAGRALAAAALLALVALSTPLVGSALLATLEREPALALEGPLPAADAIAVLGADTERSAPEYGGVTVGALALERLRYAARLAKRSGLPVLVCGGAARAGVPSAGELMRDALREDFGIEARWVETRSSNTRENADFSAPLLAVDGVRRVLLVTHAWHLPRARACFERTGFEVVGAPTGFHVRPGFELGDLVPTAKGLRHSAFALHEWIGRAWYALAGGSSGD